MDEFSERTASKSILSIVSGWFKSGIVEISCSSRVGQIRLMLNGLKNEKKRVAQDMGLKVYSLLEKGELKIPVVKDLFLEIRQIDKTIRVREAEIEQIIKDKDVRLLEVSGESSTSSWMAEESPKEKPVEPEPEKVVKKEAEKTPAKKTSVEKTQVPKTPVRKTQAKKTRVKQAAATPGKEKVKNTGAETKGSPKTGEKKPPSGDQSTSVKKSTGKPDTKDSESVKKVDTSADASKKEGKQPPPESNK